MRYFDKKLNMICFDADDLAALFETPHKIQILEQLLSKGYTLDSLPKAKDELRKIAYSMNMINDKEDVEIFLALYAFLKFYPPESKICFLLKHDSNPASIHSLVDLKKSLKEYDITDFIFSTDKGLVAHQLKAYYGEISTKALFDHIVEVLQRKYANDLGSTNLLFFLKNGGEINNDLFIELGKLLQKLKLKGEGNILIAYNEDGKFDVLNTVYPVVKTNRIERKKFEDDSNP